MKKILRKQYTLNEHNYQLKIMLYAYHEGREISSRSIEKNCKRDINYMYLLEGHRAPDCAAIARFRTNHFAKYSKAYLAQMANMLYELNQITTTEVFIDGTKIEASAGRYTFVGKNAVTKHQADKLDLRLYELKSEGKESA